MARVLGNSAGSIDRLRTFIRSYLGATESNTPRTRRALWGPGTKWKPKCVAGMAPDQNLIDKFTWTLWSPFCGDSEFSASSTLLPAIKRAHSTEAAIIPAE